MELFDAIDTGCVDNVLKILYENVDPNIFNAHECSPLHYAVEIGNIEIVEALLVGGTYPDLSTDETPTALSRAVQLDKFDIAKLLLEYGADPNNYEGHYPRTPIEYAVCLQNAKMVKLLIDFEADVEELYRVECPINNAVASGNLEITKLLIDAGAKVNSRGFGSLYTLHYAIRSGNCDVVSEVLSHGARVNAEDDLDYTSLHHAVLENSKEIVELVIDYGADLNAIDFCGRTPLFVAAKSCFVEIVKVLLRFFADVSISSGVGNTPLKITSETNSPESLEVAKLIIANIMLIPECKYLKVSNNDSYKMDLVDIENNNVWKDWKEKCLVEIEKMKKTFLGSNRHSILDLCLNCNENEITKCLNCLHSEDFIIYKQLIDDTIKRGKHRHRYLEKAMKTMETCDAREDVLSCNVLSNWNYLPKEIKYNILERLDNRELEILSDM
ncbi:ankyrin repeat protein [Fowlpox virus]|nr:ankyrin repeat protein [Fowlpox virus]